MILDCPSCFSRYELPESLLGPAGARVRCPGCGRSFAVDHSGRPIGEQGAGSPAWMDHAVAVAEPEGAAVGGQPEPPEEIARALVTALAERSGDALRAAHERGRLFAEWGPSLLDVFEEYRRRAGGRAASAAFRDALRRQLGVDLPESRGDAAP